MWKIFILLSDESATNTDEIWNFSKHIFQLSILKSFQLLIGHFYNLQHILEMWRVDIIQSHLTPRPLIFFHKAYSMAWLPLSLVSVPLPTGEIGCCLSFLWVSLWCHVRHPNVLRKYKKKASSDFSSCSLTGQNLIFVVAI